MKTREQFLRFLIGWRLYLGKAFVMIAGLVTFVIGILIPQFLPAAHPLYHFSCPYVSDVYLAPRVVVSQEPITAAIIPHHLVANGLIDATLSQINPDIRTVILIGPNHPDQETGGVQTSLADWKTPFGILSVDTGVIHQLVSRKLAIVNEYSLTFEHSVCGVVPFIKKYFPGARVIPLILKSSVSAGEQQTLGQFLSRSCYKCLLIASVDFSHDLSPASAKAADLISTDILSHLQFDQLDKVTADSRPSLGVLMAFVKNQGIASGKLVGQSDANQVLQINQSKVTSYISLIYSLPLTSK